MASLTDSMFTLVFVFGVAVAAVLGVLFMTNVQSALAPALSVSPEAVAVTGNFSSFLPNFFSWMFGILFVAVPLIGLGLALTVVVDVFWWWIYAVSSVVVLVFGFMFGRLWGYFTAPELISDAVSLMPLVDWVFSNYAAYSVFVLFVIGAGTYVKRGFGGGGAPGGFV